MDLTGTRIGQIQIDELLAEGGMGRVYLGRDLRLDRAVAVKALRSGVRDDPVGRARFVREARLLSRLDHPSICRIHGLLQHEGHDLLVLELVEGKTLGEVAEDLSHDEKLDMAIRLADALAVAHRRQVIHRDLKPENVMVTPDGTPKILDFGIARPTEATVSEDVSDDDDSRLWEASDLELEATLVGGGRFPEAVGETEALDPSFVTAGNRTVGTVAYMSPEQASEETLTVASDMYSFGVLLHELFTGRRAYEESSFLHLLARVSVAKTEPVEGVEPELARLIEKLESRDPGRRPSAVETRDRLRAIRAAPERRRRRLLARFAAAAVFVSLLLAAAALVHGRLEAERRESLAREMTREATEIEWLMRAEHLAPAHELAAARDEVRRRMAALESRRDELDGAGRAAADAALGRSALALGDEAAAVEHLSRAWEAGARDPAVAAVYGQALAERYRRARVEADRRHNPAERARRLEEAADRWLAPARSVLRRAAEAGGAEGALSRSRRAALDEKWDEALAEAARAAASRPWLYEAELLAAQIHHQRMVRRWHGEGDAAAADDALAEAREHLAAAAEVGRSDPEVHLTRCSLAYDELVMDISTVGDTGAPHRIGVEACESALALDPDLARGHLLLALLHSRRAEDTVDPESLRLLDLSRDAAERALKLDPEQPEAYRSLAMGHQIRADNVAYRGGDPTEEIEAVLAACEAGLAIAPHDIDLLNLVGNALSLLVELRIVRGLDPGPQIQEAKDAYLRAIEGTPDAAFTSVPLTNLAMIYDAEARWLLSRGRDPRPVLERGRPYLEEALERNPESPFLLRTRAAYRTAEVRWLLRRGAERIPPLDAALADAARALALRDDVFNRAEEVRTLRTAVRRNLHLDGVPGPEQEEALARSAELVEYDPELVDGRVLRAALLADLAEWHLEEGRADAAAELAREAADVARRAGELDPRNVEAARQAERAEEIASRAR